MCIGYWHTASDAYVARLGHHETTSDSPTAQHGLATYIERKKKKRTQNRQSFSYSSSLVLSRWLVVIAVWLLAVFFNLGTTQEESTAKLAVAFFSVVRGTFNAIAFLPLIVQEKELFFKQVKRRNE